MSVGAEIFILRAAKIVSRNQCEQLIANKLEVVSSGANVFKIQKYFMAQLPNM